MTGLGIALALLSNPAIALLAKITVLLLAAVAGSLVLRRASAAQRHFLWRAALIACLGVVLLSPLSPPIVVKLTTTQVETIVSGPAATPNFDGPKNGAAPPGSTRVQSRERAVTSASADWLVEHRARLLFAAWMIGSLAVLTRCLIGHIILARVIGRAQPITSAEWLIALKAAAERLGVRREVALLSSAEIGAPSTSGTWHPIILFPTHADAWPAERVRVVLAHELAHVARHDYLAHLAGTITAALLWFHPLVWYAAARMRAEAESAADDVVLAAGTSPLSYASDLLELARTSSDVFPAAVSAIGLVSNSSMERRFHAMLDTRRSRAAVSRRAAAVAMLLLFVTTIPLAGLRASVVAQRTPRVIKRAAANLELAAAVVVDTNPNFAGRWVLDTTTIDPAVRAGGARMVVTIAQTPTSMMMHGKLEYLRFRIETNTEIIFDGSRSVMTVSANGASAGAVVTSSWEGPTLVTRARGDFEGQKWEQVSRWSLSNDAATLTLSTAATIDNLKLQDGKPIVTGSGLVYALADAKLEGSLTFRRQ